ncbi:MAG: glutamate--tRNA ligase [Puniceicoccales bacterium]|jgi:glutamyl-tRNA synthetase|nr:glutamate--tRNA ligase [Puniceicoccales bacterium]
MSTVRTRFAPSPTGFFHIGSARTALFNWLYARHTGGTFILRIEDTDKERNQEAYLRVIYDSLRWLGMDWDEGPGAGGAYGPYKQSERDEIYHEYLKKLQATGRTYEKDGAVWFRLEGERYMAHEKYKDGDRLIEREVERVKAAPVHIHDLIRGEVVRAEDRDFVLVRANGEPGFHFVNVVDDITMAITHVIRGEDHLSNTSKHIELYNVLGATPPVFAHIPLILKNDGKGKMSKRDKGALIEEYQTRYFRAEAVRNFLCLLGWTPKDGREILPIEDVIAQFDLPDVHQANARFDERKMSHINQQYLRGLPVETLDALAVDVLRQAGLIGDGTDAQLLQTVLSLVREKAQGLEQLPALAGYFFTRDYKEDPKAREALEKKGDPVVRVRELLPVLEKLPALDDATAVDTAIAETAAAHGAKSGEYFAPLRFAVSGANGGPHLHEVLRLLGRDEVLARAQRFIAFVPQVSKSAPADKQ